MQCWAHANFLALQHQHQRQVSNVSKRLAPVPVLGRRRGPRLRARDHATF